MKNAKTEALEILQDIKEIVSELNGFVVKHNLLPVETVTNPFMGKAGAVPKKLTSILEISVACDEQIDALENTSNREAKPE